MRVLKFCSFQFKQAIGRAGSLFVIILEMSWVRHINGLVERLNALSRTRTNFVWSILLYSLESLLIGYTIVSFILIVCFTMISPFIFIVLTSVFFVGRISQAVLSIGSFEKTLLMFRFILPKRYREEVIGDILESAHEMKAEKLPRMIRFFILLFKLTVTLLAVYRTKLQDFSTPKTNIDRKD